MILRPARKCVDLTILVPHEIELRDWHGRRLCADAEKSADIDHDLGGWP